MSYADCLFIAEQRKKLYKLLEEIKLEAMQQEEPKAAYEVLDLVERVKEAMEP